MERLRWKLGLEVKEVRGPVRRKVTKQTGEQLAQSRSWGRRVLWAETGQ